MASTPSTCASPAAGRPVRPAGSALIGAFVAVVVLLDVLSAFGLQPMHPSITSRAISDDLRGPVAGLAVAGFLALAGGGASRAAESWAREQRVLGALLVAYALGVALAAVTDPHGAAHGVGAGVAFLVVPIGVLVGPAGRRVWWFGLIALSFLTWPVHVPGAWGFGCGERLTVGLETAWLLLVSGRAADGSRRPARTPRPS